MLRRLARTLGAAALLAAPARAQYVTAHASIHERTNDFLRFRQVCGTGVVGEGLLASVSAVTVSYACAGATAFGDATGGALRFAATVKGEGVTEPLFPPPYAPGGGGQAARVAQVGIGFGDVLTFGAAAPAMVRFHYALTGVREHLPAPTPPGAAPTLLNSRASVSLTWGDGEDEAAGFVAPLGATDVHGHFDVPVVGSTLAYFLNGSAFALLSSSMTAPVFALRGEVIVDFAHTLQLTRVVALDAAGADVTAGAGLSSRVFTFAADGTVTGGHVVATPEPSTLALLAGGVTALLLGARRRRHG